MGDSVRKALFWGDKLFVMSASDLSFENHYYTPFTPANTHKS